MEEIKELDFSQFHPLDHRLFSARCRAHYGGAWNHLKLWWWYKFDGPGRIKRQTHCRWGRHDFAGGEEITMLGRTSRVQRCCRWCQVDDPGWDYERQQSRG